MSKSRKSVILLLLLCIGIALLLALYFNARPHTTTTRFAVERAGPAWAYPDPQLTPGAANPDVTQANIEDTICNPDWSTKSVRPPSSYTTRLKREQMEELHLSGSTRDYEEDHLIPLELGGDPRDPRNLWPEAYGTNPGARQKDVVENYLHKQVCSGAMTLRDAQRAIATDWYRVYRQIEPTQVNVGH